jgi:hypothetical protein
MDNTIIAAVICVLGTLSGVLIGSIISKRTADRTIQESHKNAIKLIQGQEFIKAAIKLRESFMPIIEVLNPAEFALKEDLAIFLEDRFKEVRRAVIEFSYFLPPETKSAFWDAWYDYHRYPNYKEHGFIIPCFPQYTCIGKSNQQKKEIKQIVLSRVETILEFTHFE